MGCIARSKIKAIKLYFFLEAKVTSKKNQFASRACATYLALESMDQSDSQFFEL